MAQPLVPWWVGLAVFVLSAAVNFVMANGPTQGLSMQQMFIAGIASTVLTAIALFLNLKLPTRQ